LKLTHINDVTLTDAIILNYVIYAPFQQVMSGLHVPFPQVVPGLDEVVFPRGIALLGDDIHGTHGISVDDAPVVDAAMAADWMLAIINGLRFHGSKFRIVMITKSFRDATDSKTIK
jgi:hypothetical protein